MPEQVLLQKEISFFFLNNTIKMQRKLNPKTYTKIMLRIWLEQANEWKEIQSRSGASSPTPLTALVLLLK